MRFKSSISAVICILSFCANTYAGDPAIVTQAQTSPPKISLLFKHQYKSAPDLCREYKRKEIIGNLLIPTGACAMGGGAYMIYKGTYNVVAQYKLGNYDYRNQTSSRHDVAFVCAGTALFVAGVAMLPGGLIMASVARVKHCKYCRAGGAINITPGNTGLGLACNF